MLLNIFTRPFTLHCVTIRVKNRNKRELFLPLTALFYTKINNQNSFSSLHQPQLQPDKNIRNKSIPLQKK